MISDPHVGTRVHHRLRSIVRVERRHKGGGGPSPMQMMMYQQSQESAAADRQREAQARQDEQDRIAAQQRRDDQAASDARYAAQNPPAPVIPPTYADPTTGRTFTTPDDLNKSIDTREQEARDIQAQKDAQVQADKDRTRADFTTRSADARTNAEKAIRSYFTNQGLDPEKYWSTDIAPALDTEKNSIQDLDPNPQAAYAPTLGAQIVNDLTSGRRSKALSAINSEFSPTYASTAIPYTADDATIEQLLSSQFDPLSAQLTNAQKRGTLNDTGYQAALAAMETARTGGRSTISKLGTGIIDNDRTGLNDYITSAKNDASNLALSNADSFDPGAYLSEAQSRTGSYLSSLPGDLTNAVGDTKFSDLTSLLNAGGSVQGAYDPTATNPNGTGGTPSDKYIADQALANTKRGIGNAGAF